MVPYTHTQTCQQRPCSCFYFILPLNPFCRWSSWWMMMMVIIMVAATFWLLVLNPQKQNKIKKKSSVLQPRPDHNNDYHTFHAWKSLSMSFIHLNMSISVLQIHYLYLSYTHIFLVCIYLIGKQTTKKKKRWYNLPKLHIHKSSFSLWNSPNGYIL